LSSDVTKSLARAAEAAKRVLKTTATAVVRMGSFSLQDSCAECVGAQP
jgi:hypothetical protein